MPDELVVCTLVVQIPQQNHVVHAGRSNIAAARVEVEGGD